MGGVVWEGMAQMLDPSRELRFTRSKQSVYFALILGVLLAAVVTLLLIFSTVVHETGSSEALPYPFYLIPLLLSLAALSGWLSYHCMSKPYLILSSLGVELFPFWRPFKNFQLVEWGIIEEVEVEGSKITLHFNKEKTSGVVFTRAPLSDKSQKLLIEALSRVTMMKKSK